LHGLDRPVVLAVLNVTPDSFSDGGLWAERDDAVLHGLGLVAAGADAVDVGGESTRPGAGRVPEQEELRRTIEVVRTLAGHGVPVSIDTMRASVAEAALEAGAIMVNDVSGGLADPAMARVVAAAGCPFVVMHWRGHSEQMVTRARYDDVVGEVRDELAARVDVLVAAGLDPANLPAVEAGRAYVAGHKREKPKAWKDIWGAGQGAGVIDDVPDVAALVDRLEREYRAAASRVAGLVA